MSSSFCTLQPGAPKVLQVRVASFFCIFAFRGIASEHQLRVSDGCTRESLARERCDYRGSFGRRHRFGECAGNTSMETSTERSENKEDNAPGGKRKA